MSFFAMLGVDKEAYVRPFAAALSANGITYWLDEAEIKWGDRITEKINEGLRQARVVVVFLSEAFLGRRWPEAELGSVLSREASTGEIVVLPLLVTSDSVVREQYPLLRDKHFERWEVGIPALVSALMERLAIAYRVDWSYCHPAAYSGKVWIQVVPKVENRRTAHKYSVRWGPWLYGGVLQLSDSESLSLWHMKRDDGESDPIFFSISPPCYVVFGQGDPPSEQTRDINHGWERVEDG